ncbi:hypothetical protein VN24_01370 [Paenibacillus beijingensis]|uniref:Uncharacterized protein n=1 Tax=Paenibacillus beijingensis TaxID=1126833 RepID=A0A0D5NF22_9BACL|nr:hypothetical protein VN24_01370 [Paenibacillus beijingensis]
MVEWSELVERSMLKNQFAGRYVLVTTQMIFFIIVDMFQQKYRRVRRVHHLFGVFIRMQGNHNLRIGMNNGNPALHQQIAK